MAALFYVRLIGFAIGTLVYLFLLALILGHRRPRLLERLLFFLVLSLFLIFAGGLLEMNARIQYTVPPELTRLFAASLIALGILFLFPLAVHTHAEYFQQASRRRLQTSFMALVYLIYLVPLNSLLIAAIESHRQSTPWYSTAVGSLLTHSGVVLVSCLIVGGLLQLFIARSANAPVERRLFQCLFWVSCFLAVFLALREFAPGLSPMQGDAVSAAIILSGILPGGLLIYYALRHNFLEFGAQRNLLYALSAISLAVLYLALVHRVSGWLASTLPPEATASILLFALLFLFEPLERLIGPLLYKNFTARIGYLQRLTIEIQEQARQGRVAPLLAFAEEKIREELSLAGVRISVPRQATGKPLEIPGGLGHAVSVPLLKEKGEIGVLEAVSTGAYLTGETSAALEFLAEQLPAMIDLARLIEEKLQLERELAERERLALLGQMAASVSHNLRNPLSSMKTILQVQLEHPDLPLDVRHDCALVVDEIDRMSVKLKQLLNFAKPSVNGQRIAAVALARQTAALFGRDAERRNVRMEFDSPADEIAIVASEEAFTEALSNLLVNAIEAQPEGGRVRVSLARTAQGAEVCVEDDGPGISSELREKIYQPFFTTKVTGTGLGLSIVARRAAEMGARLDCQSPVRDAKGTRFILTLPPGAAMDSTES